MKSLCFSFLVFLAVGGCATSHESYRRVVPQMAYSHLKNCELGYGSRSLMRDFWCVEDAKRLCQEAGFEPTCWTP